MQKAGIVICCKMIPGGRRRGYAFIRIIFVILAVTSIQFSRLMGQEQEKRTPEERKLDLPISEQDSLEKSEKSQLPKIDLPEYVITGQAIIDLPMGEKRAIPDDSESSALALLLNSPLSRTRTTAQSSIPSKEEMQSDQTSAFNGKAFGSLGTFFSSHAGLWFGQGFENYVYSANGEYYRTKGFAPYTDRSGGNLGAEGSTKLTSYNPWFDQSTIGGQVSYRTDTYNWYGTRTPTNSRNRTDLAIEFGLSNWARRVLPYEADLGLESFQVTDSANSVVETQVTLSGSSRIEAFSVPLNVRIDARLGSVAYGFSSSPFSYVDLQAGSKRYAWNKFTLEGSLHAYIADGMDSQTIFRIYPHLAVEYQLSEQSALSASYEPQVKAASLSSQIFANRYVSGESIMRHTDDQQDATLALETDWSGNTRTRFAVSVQSMLDYPLYADSLNQGVWFLAYGGRSTITSFSAEVFAKLAANDYFAGTLTARVSRNSLTGSDIPYLPHFEVGASYTRQIFGQWTGIARLTLIHQRNDNVVRINTMPSILLIGLRCEYQFFRQATAFLDIQNLLSQQYEYWRGYQESPFVLSAGIALRW